MKRSFAEYILYFINERSPFGDLAKAVCQDQFFPKDSNDEAAVFTYLDRNKAYDNYKWVFIELYRRYLNFKK